MTVTNSKPCYEAMSMLPESSISVSVSISSAKGASMTTTAMADIGITLVIPVVFIIIVCVWVFVPIWSPGKVIGSIDLSIGVVESLDIAWLIVTMSPKSIVLVATIVLGGSINGCHDLLRSLSASTCEKKHS